MDKGGLRIVGTGGDGTGAGDGEPPALGATGFYYVTPTDAWDDTTLSGRHVYTRLLTLPAYILRELLKGVALSTAVFSVILMAVFAGQVMRDGIGPYTLLRVLPNFIPLICPFVLPLAIITGILICYSRLAKDNEILAAYAGGVNPFWLMLPAVLTSVIAIFITLTLNDFAMLPAIGNIERLVVDDQENILRRMIARPGNITVQAGDEYLAMSKLDPTRDPEGRAALDITRFSMDRSRPDDESFAWDPRYYFPSKRVVARDHEVKDFSDQGEEKTLKMQVSKPIFQDLHTADINRTFIAGGESGEERIVLGGRSHVTINSGRSSFWPILTLTADRRKAMDDLRAIDEARAASEAVRRELGHTRNNAERRVRVRTAEIHMRLALCFSCLAFAVLGIPLGMRTRGTMVASFVVGIITTGVYFLALKSAEAQVSR
ncbi:MAG: LptF/LptG family permease, partial [Planctomycetes bacterium]|nr:LptF/LptG family permease [Planctomycetota bacterium]